MSFELKGGGVTGDLFRSIDWTRHPLGEPQNWPSELKTMLRVMFHSRHPMFIWWGPELYQFYNDGYLPSFGLGKHPLAMGQRGFDCWPEIWPIIKPQIDLVMRGDGATWNTDQYVPIYRDGKIDDVYWTYGYSPIYGDDGSVGGTLVVCTETTRLILANRALAASEARLNLALTSSNVGFWDWNASTGYVYISETLMQDWGIDPLSFHNTLPECLERIHPDDRPRVQEEIERAFASRLTYDIEYRVVKPDGSIIFINAKGRCAADRLTGIAMNITAKKLAEIEIQHAHQLAEKARRQAELANELKSHFLANMSHEIRTPLGALLGFANLLRDSSFSESERQGFVDVICRNGENLSHIIDDILDFSKIEAGHLALDYNRHDPRKILEDIQTLLQRTAFDKGLTFELSLSSDLPPSFVTDMNRVKQILLNVVGNAIKFTEHGFVKIRASMNDGLVCFDVDDSGIGVPEAAREKIFEIFEQADGTMTRRFGGTGLGLTLARRMARSLGGDVELLRSTPDVGSSFRVSIPSLSEQEKSGPIPIKKKAAPLSQELAGLTILIVDDSADNRHLISTVLKRHGARVDLAESGSLGCSKALAGDYDLVMMDIQMPDMDGYHATHKLRSDGYRKPIVALTAHVLGDVKGECLKWGYTDYLSKPLNFRSMLDVVSRYTNRAESTL